MLKFSAVTILTLGAATFIATSSSASEYQCRQEGSALRLAIEVKKAGHTLPCNVIAEDDLNDKAVLYSARYDRTYCPARLEKKRAELEQEGWICSKSSDSYIVRGAGKLDPPTERAARGNAPASADDTTIMDSRVCKLDSGIRRIRVEVEDPNAGRPCLLNYWSTGDNSEAWQRLWRAEHDPEFCARRLDVILQKWKKDGWQCDVDDDVPEIAAVPAPAKEQPTPPSAAEIVQQAKTVDPESLQAVVEADAKRIGEWMEVEPAIEVAAHGDLNADGQDDAVVFLTYQSDQAAFRRYLMSYLVADETYKLASVKLLTGISPPPAQASVKEIDQGVIWVSLSKDDGTHQEPVGYVLRDRQLIEVGPSDQPKSASN